ncbi:formate/nitrite transporter family protein, partial [Enterococcus faecium]
ILSISIENGQKKIQKPLVAKLILGFIGGAMIFPGLFVFLCVFAPFPADFASVQAFGGGGGFPICLIVILMAGGELITGNMMAVSTAWFAKKVSFRELLVNWVTITLANMVGALFVAYFFGHYLGLT